MRPTMMTYPMTLQMILRHGARHHADSSVATFDGASFARVSFRAVADRAARLATALMALGVRANDRVATFCWNHNVHLEAYLGVPSLGAVLHTLNVRLFPAQIAYIASHAADRVMIADASLLPLIGDVLDGIDSLETILVVGGPPPELPKFKGRVVGYETLIDTHSPCERWPDLAEDSAAVACYTSGTTGNPKGVVYSHKTIFLHTLGAMGVDTFAISARDRILMLPPMFHANAWGLPYAGWFAGSRFIMPGPHLQPPKIIKMVAAERPTFTATVPTILNDLLRAHDVSPIDMSSFRVIVSGGSAVSPHLIDRVRQNWGVPILQGWGMTETSPLCVLSHPPAGVDPAAETSWRAKSGRPVPGVEVRILDDRNRPLPADGVAVGTLEVRGPWIAAGYHNHDGDGVLSQDGWLKTGDIGSIDPHGYVQVTDRAKDIIKSGGEWISSVELENRLARHPLIAEVAVIAISDPRWEERPLAVLVAHGGPISSFAPLRTFLAGEVARFWVPEYWATVDCLPKTSVGKIDKRALRAAVDAGEIRYSRDDSAL